MAIDPQAATVAMQAALSRWKLFPDDPIAKQLDQADECVQEASLMNKFLPPFMVKRGFAWKFIVAQDIFRAKIQTVRNYAGLVYLHMSAVNDEGQIPVLDDAAMSGGQESMGVAPDLAPSPDKTNDLFLGALSAHEQQGMV